MKNSIEFYRERAEVLTKYFGIYGNGNFDLSTEEIAEILRLLSVKEEKAYLECNLQLMYERLYKLRMG